MLHEHFCILLYTHCHSLNIFHKHLIYFDVIILFVDIMSAPPSPDHLPEMPEYLPILPEPNDPYLDAIDYDDEEEPYEDLVDDNEEDSDEDPEMDLDINIDDYEEDPEMDIDIEGIDDIEEVEEQMMVQQLPPLTSPPPISPSSSESNHTTPAQVPKSTYEFGGTSTSTPMFMNSAQYEIYSLRQALNLTQLKVQSMARQMNDYEYKVHSAKMDAMNAQDDLYWFKLDMSYVQKNLTHVGEIVLNPLTGLDDVKDRLTLVERAQEQDAVQIHKLLNRLNTAEIRLDVANFDRYQLKNDLCGMQTQMSSIQQRLYQKDVKEYRPNESVDVLATRGINNPSGLRQPSNQY
jgi:hypothetical protein